MLRLKIALLILATTLLPLLTSSLIPNQFVIILGIFIALISLFVLYILIKPLETAEKTFNLMAEKLKVDYQKLEVEKGLVWREKSKMDMILSSMIDGIIALDFNKNIMLMNKAAEQITGFKLAGIEGKPINQFIHQFSGTDEVLPNTFCQNSYQQTLTLVGKNGKQTKINLSTAIISSDTQTNLGCILILHDLTKEEELERMKLDFVSMASHELKTPLTSIVGYLTVFLDENKNKLQKEQADLLDRALISSRQLLSLVGNLLNVNKIERDQLAVSLQPLDYLSILNKAVTDLQNQAKLKNITLTLNLPQNPIPNIMADPIRITEVLDNLISNAINYTNSGGSVDISIQLTPVEVETIVSDTGIGIPQESIPQLFNKFYRVSAATQKASKGTGLGLYISKSIIEKHNGKIWVESKLNQGSKFHFSLPLVTKAETVIESDKFTGQAIQTGALNY